MIKKEIQIKNKLGLHARPASKLVKTVSEGASKVFIHRDGKRINAKSILGVMLLEAEYGSRVTVEIDGDDEEELMMRICELFEGKFGED